MFKSIILGILFYAIISINLAVLSGEIRILTAWFSIGMTTMAAITTTWLGE